MAGAVQVPRTAEQQLRCSSPDFSCFHHAHLSYVSCLHSLNRSFEMDIALWKQALKQDRTMIEYKVLLLVFESGFINQVISSHTFRELRWYTPPNHQWAVMAVEKMIELSQLCNTQGLMLQLKTPSTGKKTCSTACS
ncbi:hypothetical protein VP01_3450g1 [Puccinia sorghi]|uniref:Uncharacterized protein n=1 Tax=Puccinia sorghi TaxID=27349 RepID=A0A0L6UW52_9BASI|nr:hypothetical protein VP01_3450g1 [Puccinia sorghi]